MVDVCASEGVDHKVLHSWENVVVEVKVGMLFFQEGFEGREGERVSRLMVAV